MKASLDRTGCIGCGLCASVCPALFEMADDGLAELISELDEKTLAAAKDVEYNCPSGVIKIEE